MKKNTITVLVAAALVTGVAAWLFGICLESAN